MSQTSLQRKEQILKEAARLFRKKGYPATTMRDIAGALDIEAPSLYNHINSKHDLLSIILIGVAKQYVAQIESVGPSFSTKAVDRLTEIIKGHIEISYHNIDAVSLIPSEYIHLQPPAREIFKSLRDRYDEAFRTLLVEGIADRSIKEVDVDLTNFAILSTLRFVYSWIRKHKDVSLQEVQDKLVNNLVHGIAVPKT